VKWSDGAVESTAQKKVGEKITVDLTGDDDVDKGENKRMVGAKRTRDGSKNGSGGSLIKEPSKRRRRV